jgi:hypothetical protein
MASHFRIVARAYFRTALPLDQLARAAFVRWHLRHERAPNKVIMELNDAQRAAFCRDGYLHIPSAISHELVGQRARQHQR